MASALAGGYLAARQDIVFGEIRTVAARFRGNTVYETPA